MWLQSTENLSVFIVDVKIVLMSQNTTCLVNASDRIQLICNAMGNPTSTSWMHNGEELASSTYASNDGKHIVGSAETNVSIENRQMNAVQIKLTLENCAVGVNRFECVACNQFSRDRQSVFVIGYLKPTFSIASNETYKLVNESATVTFDCNVNGYPEPVIAFWSKV